MGIQAFVDSVIAAATSAASAASSAIASGATALGVGPETAAALGQAGVSALEQGAVGAALDPRAPLKGFESGAISGGVMGGFAPLVSDTLGVGMTAADALTGAAGGALGSLATGGKPLSGALQGGLSGAAAGALGLGPQAPTATPTPTPAAGTGGGPVGSAAGAAAPASVPTAGPDVTQPLQTPAQSLAATPTPGTVGAGAAAGGGTTNVGGPAATTLPATATPTTLTATAPPGTIQPTQTPVTSTAGVTQQTPGVTVAGGSSGLDKFLSNPSALLTTAGMASSLMGGNKLPKQAGILSAQAADLVGRGQRLENYMETGTLPPGAQQSIDAATAAGEAAIRQGYANRGMSGSSAELQEIQSLHINAATQGQDIAMKLMAQGVQDTQLGNDIYSSLLNIQMQQDQQFSDSIAGFASSLAGMGRPYSFTQPTTTGG